MIILSTSAAWAQSKDKFDATSVKLRNMENGITEILDRITKLEIKVDRSNLAEELQSNYSRTTNCNVRDPTENVTFINRNLR